MANTIPSNNNTGLYIGSTSQVPIGGNIDANNINATGNVTVNGFILANGSITTNSNFVGNLIGNVSGNISLAGGNTEVVFNNNGVTDSSPNFTFDSDTNVLSVVGNISGNYLFGNGSQLTGIVTGYGNSNVNNHLANFGSNTISTSGNITGGYFFGDGSQLTGLPATYGNSNVAAFLPTYSGDLNPGNVSASGNVTAAYLKTSGLSGNITGANYVVAGYFVGDGGLLSNISGSYGNSNVTSLLASFGSNTISTTGNISGGNLNLGINGNAYVYDASVTGGVYVTGVVSAAGNVRGGNINTSGLVTATGNVTGGNVLTGGLISATSNITGGNLLTGGIVSATGNVTGAYFFGNGSQLTGLTTSAAGSNTQIQYNDAGAFAGNSAMTFNNITGNIILGNIVTNTNQIQTVGAIDYANATAAATTVPWRVLLGNGYNGTVNNYVSLTSAGTLTAPYSSPRLTVSDLVSLPNTGMRVNEALFSNWIIPTTNISNNSTRLAASRSELTVGGSTSNYNITGTSPFLLGSHTATLYVGAGTNANLSAVGNTVVSGGGSPMITNMTIGAGSSVTYGTGLIAQLAPVDSGGLYGNIVNSVGFVAQFQNNPANANVSGTTTAAGFYLPPNDTTGIYGSNLSAGNIARSATTYHAFRNDDNLAKSRLGALERFHYYTANVTSSGGAVTIDKTNGQVQQLYATENITSVTFSNFQVRQTKPNSTFQNSSDVVTFIIQQGATPYNITLPTGNAQIRYANGVNSITGVANTTCTIDIMGVYNYNTSATNYLVTVNPTFS